MDWPQPFITIDQNQLRRTDSLSQIADECRKRRLHLLIPDLAFQEFGKSGRFFETAKQSLQGVAPYRDLLSIARPMRILIAEALASGEPSKTLAHHGTTAYVRTLLSDSDAFESELRDLADGAVARLMPEALAAWNDHEENKRIVQGIHDAFKRDMQVAKLKSLRQSPETAAAEWLSSIHGSRFVFQWFIQQKVNQVTAVYLTREPNAAASFISALAALAIDWLAMGGIDSTCATNLSCDLHDIEYIVLGSLSQSLATRDRRAARICRAVVTGFEIRRSPSWLISDLTHF